MSSPIERMIDAACGYVEPEEPQEKKIYPRRMFARKGYCERCGHSFTSHQVQADYAENFKPNVYWCIGMCACVIERERTKREIEKDRIAGYDQ